MNTARRPTAQGVGRAAVATLSALIAVIFAWNLMSAITALRLGVAIALTLPLICFLPPLLRHRRRGYAALTLCLVPYLVGALTELVANPAARTWAASTLLLAFALFVLAILYLRLTRIEQAAAPSA